MYEVATAQTPWMETISLRLPLIRQICPSAPLNCPPVTLTLSPLWNRGLSSPRNSSPVSPADVTIMNISISLSGIADGTFFPASSLVYSMTWPSRPCRISMTFCPSHWKNIREETMGLRVSTIFPPRSTVTVSQGR